MGAWDSDPETRVDDAVPQVKRTFTCSACGQVNESSRCLSCESKAYQDEKNRRTAAFTAAAKVDPTDTRMVANYNWDTGETTLVSVREYLISHPEARYFDGTRENRNKVCASAEAQPDDLE
jgi:hypothetical protein